MTVAALLADLTTCVVSLLRRRFAWMRGSVAAIRLCAATLRCHTKFTVMIADQLADARQRKVDVVIGSKVAIFSCCLSPAFIGPG